MRSTILYKNSNLSRALCNYILKMFIIDQIISDYAYTHIKKYNKITLPIVDHRFQKESHLQHKIESR